MKTGDREEIPADDLAGIANWMLQQRVTEGSPDGGITFTPPPPEEIATLFEDFTNISLIGHGGMGAVYRAEQIKLGREVAIKILSPAKKRDSGFRERFAREALSMAQMDHPNIVSIYETGVRDELFYIVMEYVPGKTLRDIISEKFENDLSPLEIMPQLCAGLEHAHQRGVLHRDLKPRNILVRKDGRVKIADFGLAKLIDETKSDFTLTLTDIALGTPAYMAPEQSQSLRDVDERADIYSLGVVFYEMLTGKLPVGRFDPPSKDEHLNGIVLKALDNLPENRFQTVTELSQTLAKSPAPWRRWKKPALVALTAILATTAFFAFKQDPPPDLSKNSLGMEFTPIPGTNILISTWETRVSDFQAFVDATGHLAEEGMLTFDTSQPNMPLRILGGTWKSPGFPQNKNHPVVGVNQEDAIAFCEWLTERERNLGHLTADQFYRLPTDQEWTIASGLNENPPAQTPINRALTDYLPWDEQSPPPPGSGNFADSSTKNLFPRLPTMTDYHDGHSATSPVDKTLLGNAWEWTSNSTLRGGSWTTGTFAHILPGLRIKWSPDLRRNDLGFRCVLVSKTPPP